MKYRIILLFLLFGGWLQGYAESTLDEANIVEKDGLVYERGADVPFTGKVTDVFVDGQLQFQAYYKDGLKDGSESTWYNNGQLRSKCNYKMGKKDGMWIKFGRNGAVQLQKLYQDGNRIQ